MTSIRGRLARLEAAQRSRHELPAIVFVPREYEPDYRSEQARIEAMKAAGRTLIVIDDCNGRHERWAGGRRIG